MGRVSVPPLVRVAAQKNADWCDAFCRTHRVVGRLLVRWAPLLRVKGPVITLAPSGRQREPAPVARSGTCRAPSTTTSGGRPARGERRALPLCRRLRVSQAGRCRTSGRRRQPQVRPVSRRHVDGRGVVPQGAGRRPAVVTRTSPVRTGSALLSELLPIAASMFQGAPTRIQRVLRRPNRTVCPCCSVCS
jgi:hypothetical protein